MTQQKALNAPKMSVYYIYTHRPRVSACSCV